MILVKIGQNFKFGQNLHKNISILLETSQFWSKFLKIVILVKFVKKNLDWSQNFRNNSTLAKIFENVNFGENFRKISILITIFENLDYCQFFRKISIWSNFRKFPIYVKLSKNLNYGQNCRKIAILVEIGENFKIFDKSRFYSKHLDFGRNSRKSRFWSQFLKYLEWSQDFRNISILIKICKISQFLAKI